MSRINRAAKDLIKASEAYRVATNNLHLAENPEDVEEATDAQHEAYLALESAEYYMNKALVAEWKNEYER